MQQQLKNINAILLSAKYAFESMNDMWRKTFIEDKVGAAGFRSHLYAQAGVICVLLSVRFIHLFNEDVIGIPIAFAMVRALKVITLLSIIVMIPAQLMLLEYWFKHINLWTRGFQLSFTFFYDHYKQQ